MKKMILAATVAALTLSVAPAQAQMNSSGSMNDQSSGSMQNGSMSNGSMQNGSMSSSTTKMHSRTTTMTHTGKRKMHHRRTMHHKRMMHPKASMSTTTTSTTTQPQ